MKKVKDVFNENEGFFTQLLNDNPELFNELFIEFYKNQENEEISNNYALSTAMLFNINFVAICGERYIAPIVTVSKSMKNLTELIIRQYFNSWKKVKSALFADYDIVNPTKITITTDKDFQSDKSTNNENTENNYIYPFNENAESVNEGKNVSASTNAVANTERMTQTVTREGNTNSKPADLITAEIQTRKITFLSLVLNDIKEFCTLQVYD